MIFDERQPEILYGKLGKTYVFCNEKELQVEEPVYGEGMEEEPETHKVTKYQYDVRIINPLTKDETGVIEALKKQVSEELDAFDNGEYAKYGEKAVNDFTVSGMHMWLDKETRNGLRFRFESQQALGQSETTLWYGTISVPLQIEQAIGMLQMLEVYASQCFDQTAMHQKAISELNTVSEVFNYDYTQGYPSHLSF